MVDTRKLLGLEAEATDEQVAEMLVERGVSDGKLFGQEDMNHFLAADKKRVREENEQLRKQLDDGRKAQEALSLRIEKALAHTTESASQGNGGEGAGGEAGKGADDPLASGAGAVKHIQGQLTKLEQRLGEQGKELAAAKQEAEEARQQAKTKDRDSRLMNAGSKVRMKDSADAILFYGSRMHWNDETGQWVFHNAGGLPTESIEAGLQEALLERPYLIEPKNEGGAGSGGGGADGSPLKGLERELATVMAELTKNPSDDMLLTRSIDIRTQISKAKAKKGG